MKNSDPSKIYVRNQQLATVKKNYPGNLVLNGMFANGDKLFIPDFSDVLKWKLTPNPQQAEKKNDTYRVPVKADASIFSSGHDMIVWLGHATFFIRLAGITFLTDPVLFDLPFLKRKVPFPFPPEVVTGIDYLLFSHGHPDHLDKRSVKAIYHHNPNLQALGPLNMQALLKKMVPEMPFQEAGWFQEFSLPHSPVKVYFTPARHWYRRGLFDLNKVLWGGFILKSEATTIYFAGDTAFDDHFEEIFDVFEPDYCLLPIGAYKPAFMMKKSHINPHEATKAFNILRGHTFIPMHYGTFDLSDEPIGEPVRLMQQIADAGQLHGTLLFPAAGEPVLLPDS